MMSGDGSHQGGFTCNDVQIGDGLRTPEPTREPSSLFFGEQGLTRLTAGLSVSLSNLPNARPSNTHRWS